MEEEKPTEEEKPAEEEKPVEEEKHAVTETKPTETEEKPETKPTETEERPRRRGGRPVRVATEKKNPTVSFTSTDRFRQ